MKKSKAKKNKADGPTILELLDRVEAEMQRLRTENASLTPKPQEPKMRKISKPPALGKGLSQLFGGPRRLDG